MPETYGLQQPAVDAPPEEWTAYRQAWSERAVAARRQHGEALLSELRAKIQYADCERAVEAFTQVLDAACVDAWTAANAQFKLESWDGSGFPDGEGLDQTEHNAATAWRTAVEAARVELCDRAPFVSSEAFGLVDFLDRDPTKTFEQVFRLSLMKEAKSNSN